MLILAKKCAPKSVLPPPLVTPLSMLQVHLQRRFKDRRPGDNFDWRPGDNFDWRLLAPVTKSKLKETIKKLKKSNFDEFLQSKIRC